MPEVAEVAHVVAQLRRHILGYRINRLDLPQDSLLFPQIKTASDPAKTLHQFSSLLSQSRIQNVGRHGKYFWIRTETPAKEIAVILLHFGMTGMVKMRGIQSHLIMMENGGDKKVKQEMLMESGRVMETLESVVKCEIDDNVKESLHDELLESTNDNVKESVSDTKQLFESTDDNVKESLHDELLESTDVSVKESVPDLSKSTDVSVKESVPDLSKSTDVSVKDSVADLSKSTDVSVKDSVPDLSKSTDDNVSVPVLSKSRSVKKSLPEYKEVSSFSNHFSSVKKSDDWPPRFTKFQLFLEHPETKNTIDFAFTDPRRLGRVQIFTGPQFSTNTGLLENCPSLKKLGPDYSKSGNGEVADSKSGNPQVADSKSGNGEVGDSKSGNGEVGDSKSGNGEVADSKSGNGEVADSKSGNGEVADSKSGNGEVADSKSGNPQVADSKSGNPQVGAFKSGDPDPEHHGKPRLNFADFARLVLSKKKPIKSFLLDQEFFAGIGNWVSDEILYHARIYPGENLSSKIDDPAHPVLKRLYDSTLYVMEESVRLEGNVREFPEDWLMLHRWGKGRKQPKAKVSHGYSVDFETIGGRTCCFVKELQRPLKREHLDSSKREHLDSSKREHLDSSKREHLDSSKREHLDSSKREHLDPLKREHLDSKSQGRRKKTKLENVQLDLPEASPRRRSTRARK